MNQATLDRLNAADDPEAIWNPADFRYWREIGAIIQLKTGLEAATGLTFDLDRGVQDATFFADMTAPLSGLNPSGQSILGVRFSSFGKLVTFWMHPNDATMPPDLLRDLVATLEQHGYVYIDPQSLEEPYNGANPLFHQDMGDGKPTWFYRFFNYL